MEKKKLMVKGGLCVFTVVALGAGFMLGSSSSRNVVTTEDPQLANQPPVEYLSEMDDIDLFNDLTADFGGMNVGGAGELVNVVSEVIPREDQLEFVGRDGRMSLMLPEGWTPRPVDETTQSDIFGQNPDQTAFLGAGPVLHQVNTLADASRTIWGQINPTFEGEINGRPAIVGWIPDNGVTDWAAVLQLEDGSFYEIIFIPVIPEFPGDGYTQMDGDDFLNIVRSLEFR